MRIFHNFVGKLQEYDNWGIIWFFLIIYSAINLKMKKLYDNVLVTLLDRAFLEVAVMEVQDLKLKGNLKIRLLFIWKLL